MIHLKLRSSYSFQQAYGQPHQIIDAVGPTTAIGIADTNTWGHVKFYDACKKANVKPILGVQIPISNSDSLTRTREAYNYMTFIARTQEGLKEIYHLMSMAYDNFYYVPRLKWSTILKVTKNIIILSGNNPHEELLDLQHMYLEANPSFGHWNSRILNMGKQIVPTCDNYYPTYEDKGAYFAIAGVNARDRVHPTHILSKDELSIELDGIPESAYRFTHELADSIEDLSLPKAKMVSFNGVDLRKMCEDGKLKRPKLKWDEEYQARLDRELDMIQQKGYEDYFYLVADVVNYAKQHMLVGPARGSAAGSLVSYLMGITDVDPIQHGLIFERFIDITREDLPDIDLDFPDSERKYIIDYLVTKYGHNSVAHIGTVSTYKPKAAISDVAKNFRIPIYETEAVKKSIIERSGGDARAAFCIEDTFTTSELGKQFIEKYPEMKIAGSIEGHPRHTGVHAAGIIVCDGDIKDYCSVDRSKDVATVDKKDAEKLGILKLDILGLRTLSILNNVLGQIGKDREWLVDLELNDEASFKTMTDGKLTGIFQFEGYALKSLNRQMGVRCFDDIVAITSLARPGPLHCGGATKFVERRLDENKVEYLHELTKPFTMDTLGTIVYQEQVMLIAKELGKMTWEHVSELRKAMSKSLGEEFFNKYWEMFKKGASENGIAEKDSKYIWDNMCTFGSWAFNKSHAVSYGLLSYWCAYLKTHYPLEFALGCLQNEKDEESTIKLLRELVKEGIGYKPFDIDKSELHWSIKDGCLIGGFTNIKGIGQKKAEDIMSRREAGVKLTPSQHKLLSEAKTPYDDIFECQRRFGDYYTSPEKYKITSRDVSYIKDIKDEKGLCIFIAKMKEKKLRDLNEYGAISERDGKLVERNNLFLNLVMEDDTDTIVATIDRWKYPSIGKPIVDYGQIGDYYLVKGRIKNSWGKMHIEKIRKL